ncbi:hypothetical protein Droror1_Dr00021540 [Drosera rotundifolia]
MSPTSLSAALPIAHTHPFNRYYERRRRRHGSLKKHNLIGAVMRRRSVFSVSNAATAAGSHRFAQRPLASAPLTAATANACHRNHRAEPSSREPDAASASPNSGSPKLF